MLLFWKSCVKKPLAGAGMLALLRVAVSDCSVVASTCPGGPFSSPVTPTSLPNFSSCEGGSGDNMLGEGMRRCVLLGYHHDLQCWIHPAIMAAAAQVFPAPKTPLMGPWTNTVSTARSDSQGLSITNGRMAALLQKPMRWKHAGQIEVTSQKQQAMVPAHLERWV